MKKHLHTFEEFIGDKEVEKIRKAAIDQQKKDGDEIIPDPDENEPINVDPNSDDSDDAEGI